MNHERKPNRMHGYDYSRNNQYFFTTCVHNHICCFGEVIQTSIPEENSNHIHLGGIGNIEMGGINQFRLGGPNQFHIGGTNHFHNVGTGRDPSLHYNFNPTKPHDFNPSLPNKFNPLTPNENAPSKSNEINPSTTNENHRHITYASRHDNQVENTPSTPTIQNLSHQSLRSRKQMRLNEYGQIALAQWHWLGDRYPYVVLHAFVVMPNHIHGILEIDSSRVSTLDYNPDSSRKFTEKSSDARLPLLTEPEPQNQMKIKSLSELIGAYKTTVSKQIHLLGYKDFQWQRSFHDSIILNQAAYFAISRYILTNPQRWEVDSLYLR